MADSNDRSLLIQVQDSIVTGSLEHFSSLVKCNSNHILTLNNSNGMTPIHLVVLYKRESFLEYLISLKLCDTVNDRVELGLTPLHYVLTKPARFGTSNTYYNKLNIYPTLREKRVMFSLVRLLAISGAKLLRCEHNLSVISLAMITKMDALKCRLIEYFDLEVSHVFDYFNILVYTTIDHMQARPLRDVCRKRIVFLIKQGLPIDYTLVEIVPSWTSLLEEFYTNSVIESGLDMLNGVNFRLICLHKSVDIRNESLFGDVAQRFICLYSSVLKELPKQFKIYEFSVISRHLLLYIILSLESAISPRPINPNINLGNDLNSDLWQSHYRLWRSALDHLNILWVHDPIKFDITPLVHTLFKFFDERLIHIFKPNFVFASDAKVPARISFNFLCVYTTLFLYLSKEYSTYYTCSSYDRFYSYFQILLQSSRSKTPLINLFIHPINYESTFRKYNVSMEDTVSFLLYYSLDINQRSCVGTTALHEVAHQLKSPLPLIKFLLKAGAYPFSLDGQGNCFYHYFSVPIQNEIFKLPSLQRPYPLQTLCCTYLVKYAELFCFQTLLPPHVFTFLKLHTVFT